MRLLLFTIIGWFAASTNLPVAAEPMPGDGATGGRTIYEELCVRCHGTNGEGVEGEYDEALEGKLSVERLTRRIHRSMPEDEPERCVDEEAKAVAEYIYNAFYSLEAQARSQGARVELVRLTNRQYQHTVADLVGHFRGDSEVLNGERGLRATYYNHRGFRRDDQIEHRLDAVVDIPLGGTGLHAGHVGTNGFSARWEGSVMVEETGDYEFTLKTSNGARLWINDNDEPLIDAGVASGALNEHTATLRLLGGRHYPLRLDWFQFKETNTSVVLQWKPPHGVPHVIPARNLVPTTSKPTFVVETPFPPDDGSMGYERGISVSKGWDEAATYAAIEVANEILSHLDQFSHSKPGDTNRIDQLKSFCSEFVGRAFRHPLGPEQQNKYVEEQFQKASTPEEAVKRVVLLALKSPRFLYLGLDVKELDDYSIASRLSFSLWDSLPDRELWKQAEQRMLHDREAVAGRAARMLHDPRARSKILNSLHHWLQVTHVESLAKDPNLFPTFTPAVAADLRTSLNLLLEDTVWEGGSDYRNLLLADEVYVNPKLAEFFGVEAPVENEFVKVKLEPAHRSGVLTHPYLLAALAYPRSTSPIHRGVFLTRNIVGRTLNPPPIAVAFKDADFDPKMTMREKVTELTRPQACQACHSFINPLGFSLEHFDAVGRYRTEDNARPVDAVGEYTTEDGDMVQLTGARDVANFAAGNADAQRAFIEQMFHQMVKQPIRAYGAGTMDQLYQTFAVSSCNIQNLLVEIATLAALHDSKSLTTSIQKP